MTSPAAPVVRTAALALILSTGMSAAWAAVRWPQLRAGDPPDPDDLMRLQQILDWLNGQAFGDLTQHRMGPGGVAMHWSRLPDLIPAAMIRLLRPLIGGDGAERAMLILWPALLFAAFLWLAALLGRRIGVRPVETMLVALLAFPLTTLFAPGRIDHHGLQMVLLLAAMLALTGRATRVAGAGAALATVATVVIGMETVPLFAAAIAVTVLRWCRDRREDARVAGMALAMGPAALLAMAGFATDSWSLPLCDGFTRQSWTATMVGAAALATLAIIGRRVVTPRNRLACVAAVATGAAVALLGWAPACRNPYGAIDPDLAHLWLSKVGEAQDILTADPRWTFAQTGLLIVAIIVGAYRSVRAPDPLRCLLLAVAFASLALALFQLRGAYGGIAVACVLLADAVVAARRRGVVAALAMRLAAAGIAYPLLASVMPASGRPGDPADCITPATRSALTALPPSRILAPIDLGPWLIRHGHQALAAPYHRNAQGILMTYRFAAADVPQRRAMLRKADVQFVVGCDGRGLAPMAAPALWRVLP